MTGVLFVVALACATALLLFLLWGAFIMLSCAIDFGRAARVARRAQRSDA